MSTDFLSRRMDLIHVENSGGSIILKMDTSYPVKLSGIVLKIFNATQDYYRHGEVEIDNADGDIIFTIPSGGQYANSSVYDFAGRVIRGNENFSDVSGEGKYYETDSDVFKAGDYVITIIDFDNNKIYFCSESSFADFITSKDIPEYESDSMFRLYDREDEEELGNDAIELAKAFNEPTSERYSFIRNNSSEDLEVDEDIGDILYGNSTVSELIRNYDTGTEKEQVVPVAYVNTTYNNSLKQYVLPYSYFVKASAGTTDTIKFAAYQGTISDNNAQIINSVDSVQNVPLLKIYTSVDGYLNDNFKNKFAIEYDSDTFNALIGRFDRIENTSNEFESIINSGWICNTESIVALESDYGITINTASTDSLFNTKKNNLINDYYFIYEVEPIYSTLTFGEGITTHGEGYKRLIPIRKSDNYINYIQCEDFRIMARMNDANGTAHNIMVPANLFPQNESTTITKLLTPDDILGQWWNGATLSPSKEDHSRSGESIYYYDGNTYYEDEEINFFSKYFSKSFNEMTTTANASLFRTTFEIDASLVYLNFLENFEQNNKHYASIDTADFFPAIKQYIDHWIRTIFVDNTYVYYFAETRHLGKSHMDKKASISFEEGTDAYGVNAEVRSEYFRPYLFAQNSKQFTTTATDNNSSESGVVLLNYGLNFRYNTLTYDMLSSNSDDTNNSNRLNYKMYISKQCYLSQLVTYNNEPCIQIYGDNGEVYYNIYVDGEKQTDLKSFLKLLYSHSLYNLHQCNYSYTPDDTEGIGKISKINVFLEPIEINITNGIYSHSSTASTSYAGIMNAIIIYHGLSNYKVKYISDGKLREKHVRVKDGSDDDSTDLVCISEYTKVTYDNGTISSTDSTDNFLLISSETLIKNATTNDLLFPIYRDKKVALYNSDGNEVADDDDAGLYVKIYKQESTSLVPLSNYTKYVVLSDGSLQAASDDETFFYVVDKDIEDPDITDIIYPVFSSSGYNAHVILYNNEGTQASGGEYIKIYNNEFGISPYVTNAISPKIAWFGTDKYSGPFGFVDTTTTTSTSGTTTTTSTYDITKGITIDEVTDGQLESNFYFDHQTMVNRTHDNIGNLLNNNLIRYHESAAPYCEEYNNSIVKMHKNIPCYLLFDGNYFSSTYNIAYGNIRDMYHSSPGYRIHYKYILKESAYNSKINKDTFNVIAGQTLDESDFNSIYDFIKLSISHYINIDPDDPDSIRTSSPSRFNMIDTEELQEAVNKYLSGNASATGDEIHEYSYTFSYSSKNPYQANKFLITDKDGIIYENTDNKIYEAEAQAGLNKIRVISLQDEDNVDLSLTGNEDTIEADTLNWNDLVNALSNNKSIDLLESLKYLKDPVADMEVGRNYHIQKSDSYNNYNVITSIAEEVNTLSKLEGYYKYSLFGSRYNDTDNTTYYMLQNASKKYWVEELQEFYTIDYTNTTPSINKLIGNGNTSDTQAYSALKTNSTSVTYANANNFKIDDSSNNLFVTLSDSNGNLIEAGDYIIDGIPVKIVDRSNKYVCDSGGTTFSYYGWSTCIQFGMHTFKNNKVYIWLNPYNVGYTIPIPSGGGAITLPTNSSNSINNRNIFIAKSSGTSYGNPTGYISKIMKNGITVTDEYKNYVINDILPIGLVTLSLRSLGYYDVFDYDYASGADISENSNYLDSAQILQYYDMFRSNNGDGDEDINLGDDAPIGTFYQTIDDGIVKERDIIYTFSSESYGSLLLLDNYTDNYNNSTIGGSKLLKAITVKEGTTVKLHFNSMGLLDNINTISDSGGWYYNHDHDTIYKKSDTSLYNSSIGNEAVVKSIMDSLYYILKDCTDGSITTSNSSLFETLFETLQTIYTNYLNS